MAQTLNSRPCEPASFNPRATGATMTQPQIPHEGESVSIWQKDFEMIRFMPLHRDVDADVCIIGGGIAGLTTAYVLMKEGKKICLLEDQEIGSGQSGRSSAHFSVALDRTFQELENIHGTEGTKLIAQSHMAAIQMVKDIVFQENIACELETVDGHLFTTGKIKDGIEQELQAIHRAGIENAHLESSSLLPFHTDGVIRLPNQLQLNPLKYLKSLAEIIQRKGGKIFTHTHAKEIHGGPKARVITGDGYKVSCKTIVIATNTPVNNWISVHHKQTANRTYMVSALIPTGSVPRGFFSDPLESNHYIRIQSHDSSHDLVLIGGEGHRTGQEIDPESNYARLEKWSKDHFPQIGIFQNRWSGQVFESVDGLAYLGHNPFDQSNVYIITGDSGSGMTHATIGAMIITDQLMGRVNPWVELYSPSRMKLKSIRELVRENIRTVTQYAEWLKEKKIEEIDEIPLGQGSVIRKGIRRIAAYKDENGNVDLHSAVCPHLGGIVKWNAAEKSWDCPCHGSRFDCHGKVIEGPANRNLRPVRKSTIVPTPFLKKPTTPAEKTP
jgi:glycine/D-amino acid oxidase-like deaminating enzyme/nitrite reductase/ring-hydroxylating ferredoxin subunit